MADAAENVVQVEVRATLDKLEKDLLSAQQKLAAFDKTAGTQSMVNFDKATAATAKTLSGLSNDLGVAEKAQQKLVASNDNAARSFTELGKAGFGMAKNIKDGFEIAAAAGTAAAFVYRSLTTAATVAEKAHSVWNGAMRVLGLGLRAGGAAAEAAGFSLGGAAAAAGRFLGVIGLVVFGVKLFVDAIQKGREELKQMVQIAEQASAVNISPQMFQALAGGADAAKDKVEALQHAMKATMPQLDLSASVFETEKLKTKFSELEQSIQRAVMIMQGASKGPQLFFMAENQEDKVRAVLITMRDLWAMGQKLEALHLGEKMFGPQFAADIRSGKIELDELVDKMEKARESSKGMFSNEAVKMAKDLNDRLKAAHETIENSLKPATISLAALVMQFKAGWTNVVEAIASAAKKTSNVFESMGEARTKNMEARREEILSMLETGTDLHKSQRAYLQNQLNSINKLIGDLQATPREQPTIAKFSTDDVRRTMGFTGKDDASAAAEQAKMTSLERRLQHMEREAALTAAISELDKQRVRTQDMLNQIRASAFSPLQQEEMITRTLTASMQLLVGVQNQQTQARMQSMQQSVASAQMETQLAALQANNSQAALMAADKLRVSFQLQQQQQQSLVASYGQAGAAAVMSGNQQALAAQLAGQRWTELQTAVTNVVNAHGRLQAALAGGNEGEIKAAQENLAAMQALLDKAKERMKVHSDAAESIVKDYRKEQQAIEQTATAVARAKDEQRRLQERVSEQMAQAAEEERQVAAEAQRIAAATQQANQQATEFNRRWSANKALFEDMSKKLQFVAMHTPHFDPTTGNVEIPDTTGLKQVPFGINAGGFQQGDPGTGSFQNVLYGPLVKAIREDFAKQVAKALEQFGPGGFTADESLNDWTGIRFPAPTDAGLKFQQEKLAQEAMEARAKAFESQMLGSSEAVMSAFDQLLQTGGATQDTQLIKNLQMLLDTGGIGAEQYAALSRQANTLGVSEETLPQLQRLIDISSPDQQKLMLTRIIAAVNQQAPTLAREELLKQLNSQLKALTDATEGLEDAMRIQLDPLFSQGHEYLNQLRIGYYKAATGLTGIVGGSGSGDSTPVHMMLTPGELLKVYPKGAWDATDLYSGEGTKPQMAADKLALAMSRLVSSEADIVMPSEYIRAASGFEGIVTEGVGGQPTIGPNPGWGKPPGWRLGPAEVAKAIAEYVAARNQSANVPATALGWQPPEAGKPTIHNLTSDNSKVESESTINSNNKTVTNHNTFVFRGGNGGTDNRMQARQLAASFTRVMERSES